MLIMNGVELDQNGDLTMIGGIKTIGTAYSSNAHTLFSKYLNTIQHRYVATIDGNIYRDNTSIATGGHASRGAFGYCFDYVLAVSGSARKKDDGTTATNLGQTAPVAPVTLSSAGAGNLTGIYEYIQINVFGNGSYIAKSIVGPSASITVTAENVNVTGTNVTSPANETWIFRRGGTLSEYYRIKRLTSAYTTLFVDNVTDEEALEEGVTLNLLALSVAVAGLPDDIYAIAGPIHQRMLYFTKKAVHFSEINSPETYDPNRSINYSDNSTGSEVFLWAEEVSDNVVQIGTTNKRYRLTGTYITLPDGTIDVQLVGIDSKFPPISPASDVFNNGVCYMSSNGWRIGYSNGNSELLVGSIDKLYRGNSPKNNPTQAGTAVLAAGIPIYIYPATGPGGANLIYDCAVARNKLYCRMPAITLNDPTLTFSSAGHVYDFNRKYWRTGSTYEKLYAQEDGALIAFDYSDSKIKEVEYQFAKTIDGAQPSISITFPIWDLSSRRNRKDLYTLKMKTYTGASSAASVSYSLDYGKTFASLGSLSATDLTEKFFNLSALALSKSFQLRITGACDDFHLSDISVDFDQRPDQVTFIKRERVELQGLDGRRFRPRVWPLIIDTLGEDVTFTPILDGVDQATSTFNTSGKTLVHHFFITDLIGTDLGYKITGSSLFELYQVLSPEIVQVFPIAKRMDQLGPEHFFRYGKIKALEIRLTADTNATIPYKVYCQDELLSSGNLLVVGGVEDAYTIPLGKENKGIITRVVLGPTGFNFYRYYAQIQVAKSGRNTDMEWVTVGVNNG